MPKNSNVTKTELERKLSRSKKLDGVFTKALEEAAVDSEELSSLLRFMARNSELSHRSAVVAHAAMPDGSHMRTYDEWNRSYHRIVRGKGTGVLVYAADGLNTKYVFAEKFTVPGTDARPVADLSNITDRDIAFAMSVFEARELVDGALNDAASAAAGGVNSLPAAAAEMWVDDAMPVIEQELSMDAGGMELSELAAFAKECITYSFCSGLGIDAKPVTVPADITTGTLESVLKISQAVLSLALPSVERSVLRSQLGCELPERAVQLFRLAENRGEATIINDMESLEPVNDALGHEEDLEAEHADGFDAAGAVGPISGQVGQDVPEVPAGGMAGGLRAGDQPGNLEADGTGEGSRDQRAGERADRPGSPRTVAEGEGRGDGVPAVPVGAPAASRGDRGEDGSGLHAGKAGDGLAAPAPGEGEVRVADLDAGDRLLNDAEVEELASAFVGPYEFKCNVAPDGWTWRVEQIDCAKLVAPSGAVVFTAGTDDNFNYAKLLASGSSLDDLIISGFTAAACDLCRDINLDTDNLTLLREQVEASPTLRELMIIDDAADSLSSAVTVRDESIAHIMTQLGEEALERLEQVAEADEVDLQVNRALEALADARGQEAEATAADAQGVSGTEEQGEAAAEEDIQIAGEAYHAPAAINVPGYENPIFAETDGLDAVYTLPLGQVPGSAGQTLAQLEISCSVDAASGEQSWSWDVAKHTFIGSDTRPVMSGHDLYLIYGADGKLMRSATGTPLTQTDVEYSTLAEAFASFAAHADEAVENGLGIDFRSIADAEPAHAAVVEESLEDSGQAEDTGAASLIGDHPADIDLPGIEGSVGCVAGDVPIVKDHFAGFMLLHEVDWYYPVDLGIEVGTFTETPKVIIAHDPERNGWQYLDVDFTWAGTNLFMSSVTSDIRDLYFDYPEDAFEHWCLHSPKALAARNPLGVNFAEALDKMQAPEPPAPANPAMRTAADIAEARRSGALAELTGRYEWLEPDLLASLCDTAAAAARTDGIEDMTADERAAVFASRLEDACVAGYDLSPTQVHMLLSDDERLASIAAALAAAVFPDTAAEPSLDEEHAPVPVNENADRGSAEAGLGEPADGDLLQGSLFDLMASDADLGDADRVTAVKSAPTPISRPRVRKAPAAERVEPAESVEAGREAFAGTRADTSVENAAPSAEVADFADFDLLGAAPAEHKGPKSRFADNIAAIKALREVEAAGGAATDAQREAMARYVGWGGLAEAFDESNESWAAEYAELRELLSDAEYDSARASILDAFYTPVEIASSIYDTLRGMGMEGGNILDPCCGTGRFVGAAGFEQGANIYASDIDGLSCRLTKALYPSATVMNSAYEQLDIPDASFDAIVSNAPFGESAVFDGRYSQHRFTPHNYFFAKSLDMVRPGGIVALITSRWFMDAKTSKNREYMAQRAEFLGAVRLPETTFKSEAGTEAISDIVFLKRREQIKPELDAAEMAWVTTDTIERQGEELVVNSYFVDHPEQVAGDIYAKSSRFGIAVGVAEREGVDLLDAVRGCLAGVEGTYEPLAIEVSGEDIADGAEAGELSADNVVQAAPAIPNYSYGMYQDKLYFRFGELMRPAKMSKKATERVEGMVGIRDAFRRLLSAENSQYSNDEDLETLRKDLNDLYDAFSKRLGALNSNANKSAFRDDASSSMILGLEDKSGDGWVKAAIFSRRVAFPPRHVMHADTPEAALALSMSTYGRPVMSYMEDLCDMSAQDIMAQMRGKLFYEPVSDGEGAWHIDTEHIVDSSDYLSGLVRDKLAIAQEAAAYGRITGDSALAQTMDFQATALEGAVPADIPATDIAIELGSSWIPVDVYNQFIYETFNVADYLRDAAGEHSANHIGVVYDPIGSSWLVDNKSSIYSTVATVDLGVPGATNKNGLHLLEDCLNMRPSKVTYSVWDIEEHRDKQVVDREKTALAQAKQELIKARFHDWVLEDPDRAERLVRIYNDRFNITVERRYDPATIELHGANSSIELRDYQKEGVARQLYSKSNTLLYHVVGAGKTFTMAAAAQEGKRMGLHTKSLIVTPKAVVEQTAQQYSMLYPQARLLVAGASDFTRDHRKRFMARIAASDVDAVFMSNEQFSKIPMSPEFMKNYYESEIARAEMLINETRFREGKKSFTKKKLEAYKKGVEAKLRRSLNEADKDQGNITFEELGIDRLFVDEAHKYKNLALETTLAVKGGAGGDSNRAQDMLMKVSYLNNRYGEGRVTFATGTAVSNTMVELYVMQRYLQPKLLDKMGLRTFAAWASTFGEIENSLEFTPDQRFKLTARFARFQNLPELMGAFREVADIRTNDMINLDLPECENITVESEPTDFQRDYIDQLADRSDLIAAGEADPTEDNLLKVTYEGRYLAADPRTLDPSFPAGEKTTQVAANIVRVYREHDAELGCQLVFSDISSPDAMLTVRDADGHAVLDESGKPVRVEHPYSVYRDIRDQLIEAGIPEGEIAFIHDCKTAKTREEVFKKVREGKIRVLFGSTEKLGTGVNVQDRLVAIHNVDCPWRPSDLEQRLGRLVRQGNRNEKVYNFRYVTKGTFDTFLYQSVEKKQRGIGQVFTSKSPARTMEDIDEGALDYAEVKAAAAGDPRIKDRMEAQNTVDRLQLEHSAYTTAKLHAAKQLDTLPGLLESAEQAHAAALEAVSARDSADAAYLAEHREVAEALELRRAADAAMESFGLASKEYAAADQAAIEAWSTLESPSYRGLAVTVDGRESVLADAAEAGEFAKKQAIRYATAHHRAAIGRYRGFNVFAARRQSEAEGFGGDTLFGQVDSSIIFELELPDGRLAASTTGLYSTSSPKQFLKRLNAAIDGLDRTEAKLVAYIAELAQKIESARACAEAPFEKQAELDSARAKLTALNVALNWQAGVMGNDGLMGDETIGNQTSSQIRFEKGSGQLAALKEISTGQGRYKGITCEMIDAVSTPRLKADDMRDAAAWMASGGITADIVARICELSPSPAYSGDGIDYDLSKALSCAQAWHTEPSELAMLAGDGVTCDVLLAALKCPTALNPASRGVAAEPATLAAIAAANRQFNDAPAGSKESARCLTDADIADIEGVAPSMRAAYAMCKMGNLPDDTAEAVCIAAKLCGVPAPSLSLPIDRYYNIEPSKLTPLGALTACFANASPDKVRRACSIDNPSALTAAELREFLPVSGYHCFDLTPVIEVGSIDKLGEMALEALYGNDYIAPDPEEIAVGSVVADSVEDATEKSTGYNERREVHDDDVAQLQAEARKGR